MRPILFALISLLGVGCYPGTADRWALSTINLSLIKSCSGQRAGSSIELSIRENATIFVSDFSAQSADGRIVIDGTGKVTSLTQDDVSFRWTDSFQNSVDGYLSCRPSYCELTLTSDGIRSKRPEQVYGKYKNVRCSINP